MVGTGKTYPFEKKISEFQKIRLDIPDIFIIFVYRAIHNRRNSIGAHPAGAGYDSWIMFSRTDIPRKESEEVGEHILTKAVKAGRRTYFFDVRATRGNDYYLTITESRKTTVADGSVVFDRYKIFLYKEDFARFDRTLREVLDFIAACQRADEASARQKTEGPVSE